MEGRVPPGSAATYTDDSANDDPPLSPPAPLSSPPPRPSRAAETYVIQIPKDQIYRVPPPENALIVARFRNPETSKENKKKRFWPCFLCMGIALLVLGLIFGIAIMALYFTLSAEAPTYSVMHVAVKNPKPPCHEERKHFDYEISLKAENGNSRTGIRYESGRSKTFLSFRGKNVGRGAFPTLYQGGNNVSTVRLVVYGTKEALPREMAKSMNETKSDSLLFLGLKMCVPVKMYLGFVVIWSKEILINCKFKVSSLGKSSRVIMQACPTQFNP